MPLRSSPAGRPLLRHPARIVPWLALLAIPAIAGRAQAAPFKSGNVAVYRVGSGTGNLANTGNPVFIGDYFAASFFAAKKPAKLRSLLMSWDSIADEDHQPPYLRRVDEPVTFESFDAKPDADEHENGQIWSATLWDIWKALGRDVADRIVIESHFQLDGFTTFARGARAILDAGRNLFHGRNAARLARIFHSRGIGPVQQVAAGALVPMDDLLTAPA